MAIYSLPEGVSRKKGSTSGATFTRTCNGFIIRRKYKPKLSKSPRETHLRSRFAAASQHWRTMSGADQNRYNLRANQFIKTNSLGENYVLKPHVLQNEFSIIKLSNSGNYQEICEPQFDVTPPLIIGGAANVAGPVLQITYDMVTAVTDDNIALFMTRAGTWNAPFTEINALRFTEYRNLFQSTTVDMLPWYEQFFGTPDFKVGESVAFYAYNLSRFRSQRSTSTWIILHFT